MFKFTKPWSSKNWIVLSMIFTLLSTALGTVQSFIHSSFSVSTVSMWSHFWDTLRFPMVILLSDISRCSFTLTVDCRFSCLITWTLSLKCTCFSAQSDSLVVLLVQLTFLSLNSFAVASVSSSSLWHFLCLEVKKATRLGSIRSNHQNQLLQLLQHASSLVLSKLHMCIQNLTNTDWPLPNPIKITFKKGLLANIFYLPDVVSALEFMPCILLFSKKNKPISQKLLLWNFMKFKREGIN